MKFKNMKIAITDEVHLKAVCDVLESMGYVLDAVHEIDNFIHTYKRGCFKGFYSDLHWGEIVTLSDLLRMRDKMVKDNAKHRESGF